MEAGLYYDIPEAEYHAHPAISASGLKILATKTPRHFQHLYLEDGLKESKALEFGKAAHMALLEPERFAGSYAVAPECDRRTKEGKALYAAFLEQYADAEHVSHANMQIIDSMRHSLSQKIAASAVLSDGHAEVSMFAEIDGIQVRGRADWITNTGIIVDIKTAQDASESGFERDAYKYGYHIQAWLYRKLYQAITGNWIPFVFLVIEKDAPHCVQVFTASDEMLALGELQGMAALEKYRYCTQHNRYDGYSDMIVPLGIPAYAMKQLENIGAY